MPKITCVPATHKINSRRQQLLNTWRLLRKPFMLPTNSKMFHICRWEFIDIDIVACQLCGGEHKCGNECDHCVTTDDGMICGVTGVCVKTHSFACSEYTDTVNVYNSESSISCQMEQRMSYIQQYVHELLLSRDAQRVSQLQRRRSIDKYHQETVRRLKNKSLPDKTVSWIDVVQWGVNLYQKLAYDKHERQRLATYCLHVLPRVVCIVTTHLGLRIKDCELRGFIFGLIFLMRSGVCMQGIQILPQCLALNDVLPSETFMTEFRFFRAKYITDTENRFKFVFRNQTSARIQALFCTYTNNDPMIIK